MIAPLFLDDFIGQGAIKRALTTFICAANAREEAADHVLLHGPPGLGKTTIARIISNELGANFQAIPAPVVAKAADLAAVLTNMKGSKNVLFIDEIHRLNATVEEMLYSAMDDCKLSVIIGEGIAARTVVIPLASFTMIGATTRISMLGGPFRDRFGIHLRLEQYSTEELQHIIIRAATKLELVVAPEAALAMAQRARGTPRIALRLLRRIRDVANVAKLETVDEKSCVAALETLGIDEHGLDHEDRKYLGFIANNYRESHVGINTIALGLNERKETIEETIEPYLIQLGLIKKTSRGRTLTRKGLDAAAVR
jgi:Holliday junction DNA helicase RuvB